jgi:hypothetical protein
MFMSGPHGISARLAKSSILAAGFGGCMALLAMRWALDEPILRVLTLALAWLALAASLANFFRRTRASDEPSPVAVARGQYSRATVGNGHRTARRRPAFPSTFGPRIACPLLVAREACIGSKLHRPPFIYSGSKGR